MECHNCNSIGFCKLFPSLPVVQLLLFCRTPINALDCNHSTPLHDLVRSPYGYYSNEEQGEIKIIFKLLVHAGAHLDAIAEGKTPEDCAEPGKLKNLFRKYPIQVNLKCICARLIRKKELNYIDCISKHLQLFVELH